MNEHTHTPQIDRVPILGPKNPGAGMFVGNGRGEVLSACDCQKATYVSASGLAHRLQWQSKPCNRAVALWPPPSASPQS